MDMSQEANLSETGALEELDRVGMGTCVLELKKRVRTRPVQELMRQNKYRRSEGRTRTETTVRQGTERAQQGW